MNAIEKIIAQMENTANEELAQLEKNEKQRIDDDFQAASIRLMNDFEKQKVKQQELLDSKYRQLRNRQQVEIRQETLNEKQQFLTKLFTEAALQMENWQEAEVQKFALQALKQIPLKTAAKLIVGEKSQSYLTATWLTEIVAELPYDLTLSAEIVANQAGFAVDDEGVQYNFIFQDLVKDAQEQMAYEIAQQLFEQAEE
ncbi:V/A-type H+-transporting ATPase subunit E [Enterococcus sp. PF1-24]|uniref:ATPase V n=1 Tax=unclassified Enterococcus TaxID=2608891 RepID=UPI0024732DCB|nr:MULTISPECIES: ATPase V [unclassified Enterococcus]MDH6364765.1 V/A-type H+-transporting ATPase subunit E [Enterococcus sp. PFB1-1]MDH6401890.1 V/A-type H+-transporting ATPase subunit E [Enterococcus sp. PF1-24]